MRKKFDSYRREFPITQHCLYLDHAGVAPASLRVRNAVERFLAESSEGGAFHYPAWADRVAGIRSACAGLINALPDEIAFVKNTSHGLSIVAGGLDWKSGDKVVCFEKEFPSNVYPWLNLEQKGVEIKFVPLRNNRIVMDDIERLIDARTRLLAVSAVQFSSGLRVDLHRLGELCMRKNVLFCVDAIQSLGVIPMDVKTCHIDFLAADAHKWLLGPEGVGIFYCRRGLAERLAPPLVGWKSVQNETDFEHIDFRLKTDSLRFEEGSMNIMGIVGLGAAVDLLLEVGIGNIEERVLGLGDAIIREAEQRGFGVLTPREKEARAGIVTFGGNFDAVKLRDDLRARGIMVNARGGGLRVSPHFYNTEEEVSRLFQAL